MSYTPPAGNALVAMWAGLPPYTAPAGDAIVASWAATVPAVTGDGAFTFDFLIEGEAVHGVVVLGTGEFTMDFLVAGTAAHGVAGTGELTLDFLAAGVAVHPRYELRGEVRMGGVLVNRRVRAYQRESGELLGQADTEAGRFKVHAGFTAVECYVTPIDLTSDAVDWLPPTANRLLPVMADDTA